jgi:outer membrane receptor protein involved in Fe transport
MTNWHKRAFVVVGLALLALAGSAVAQTFRGSILGTVSDSSGAAIAQARVTVKNADTGFTRETQTAEDGSYAIPELPIGNYTVTVEKPGFQASVTTNVRVEVAIDRRVDATLKPGDIAQRIEVSGETLAQVETTQNILGGSFQSREVLDLPINGRDFQKLLIMVPGATGDPSGGMDSPGSFGLFSVNGNRGRANNFLLDGTDMNDGYRNLPAINQGGVFGTPGTVLPIEAIAEVRVLSSSEADFGRNAGSVVNIVTKSGTNEIHGSIFDYFRHDKLNARNYFNDQPNPKDKFRNNQFGVAVGGPLVRDKTFWYFTYEGQRERVGVTSINSVPTLADVQAAVVALGGNGAACATGTILNCLTSQPAGVINQVTLNLFNLCNTNGGCSGENNVWPLGAVSSARAFNDADSFIFKLDHSFNERHSLTGRYFRGTSDQSFPLGLAGGNNLPNTNTFSPIKAQLISISYVEVINPRWVHEARFGWNLYEQDFFPQDAAVFGNPNSSIGLNNGVTASRDFGLPTIRVSGLAALGSAPYSNPRGRDDTNLHFIEGMSYKLTRHDLKWGYEFRRTSVDSFYDAQFRGVLSFGSLADFLAGNIGGGRIVRGNTDRQARQNSHAMYFQDTWRVRPTITLNLGLRWDYFGVIQEERDRFSVYRPNQGLVLMSKLYESDLDNFSPRLSAAWDLGGKGKTVIRAGFGAFYDLFAQDFFTGQIPFNCFSCPGVAYNPTGPDPVLLSLSPIATLAPGAAIFPTATDNFDVFTVDNLRTPYVLSWNLNVQQQVSDLGVFQMGYVGSGGRKLFRIRDINAPSAVTIRAYDYFTNGCCVPRPFDSSANLDAVFAPNTPFYVNQLETTSNSTYHGLQTSFQMRNWRGLTQQINYTWAHSIDDASDGQDFVPNASQPQDSQNASGNRGDSNFDTRHRFTWSATYAFPRCERCGEWLGNGWQISSVISLQSGRPFHVNYNFLDDYDGSGTFFGRPDITGPPVYNRDDPRQFLNLNVFTVPCTLNPAGAGFAQDCTFTGGVNSMHFGSLGRNALHGPDFRNWDISISKDTRLTERFKLHARVDFFNFTNHPNFSNPWLPTFFADAAPNGLDPATGRSIGFLPITATVDTGLGNPILGGGGPRSVQFALKLLF